ncbi:hypothetical protein V6N11_047412 [Hibiscus sabdariffa]|uniref:Uncharacterized protein n=2 Tax=Hibiscus sabdariffa TaxID=183260 RepID=A0ABR2A4A7_9ROSI
MRARRLQLGNCSRLWRGLHAVWDAVPGGIQWNIQNDRKVEFWNDTWSDQTCPLRHECFYPAGSSRLLIGCCVGDSNTPMGLAEC